MLSHARRPDAGIDRLFHALGDTTRRAIMDTLSAGPVSVSHLAGPLHITVAAVLQHVQVLEQSGLVHTTKTGRVRTCHLEPAGLSTAERWISERRSTWERRSGQLGEFLAEPEAWAGA